MPTPYDLIVIRAGKISSSQYQFTNNTCIRMVRSLLNKNIPRSTPARKISRSGSVWELWRDSIYPGLKSNNIIGSCEHPDFPMLETVYGVRAGEYIPATVLHRYLTDFAEKFGIYIWIGFNTKVDIVNQVRREDGSFMSLLKD